MPGLSKSQVNKAGRSLRRWARGELVSVDEYQRALDVLLDHRADHRLPLTKATMGLRSVVKTEQCEVEVSQRLKRVPTIVDKLVREPTMQLASMQDLGGCRAVLNSFDEVRRVQRRLSKTARRCECPTTSPSLGLRATGASMSSFSTTVARSRSSCVHRRCTSGPSPSSG